MTDQKPVGTAEALYFTILVVTCILLPVILLAVVAAIALFEGWKLSVFTISIVLLIGFAIAAIASYVLGHRWLGKKIKEAEEKCYRS